jgi:hypothetical protein
MSVYHNHSMINYIWLYGDFQEIICLIIFVSVFSLQGKDASKPAALTVRLADKAESKAPV